MADLSTSRPAMTSSIEKYAPGQSSSEGGERKKPFTKPSANIAAQEAPEVASETEEHHQLDERA